MVGVVRVVGVVFVVRVFNVVGVVCVNGVQGSKMGPFGGCMPPPPIKKYGGGAPPSKIFVPTATKTKQKISQFKLSKCNNRLCSQKQQHVVVVVVVIVVIVGIRMVPYSSRAPPTIIA